MKRINLWILPLILLVLPSFALAGEMFVAKVDNDGVQRVSMTAGSYYYKPDLIVLKKGVPVEMTITRTTRITPHNIIFSGIVDGKDITKKLYREPWVAKFTPDKTGKYDFYCDKKLPFTKSHRDKGMEGIIEVVE